MTRSLVAVVRNEDKFNLFDETAEIAGFWSNLDAAFARSGKQREDYAIAIKPNLMILMNAKVPVVATDPALVEHMVKRLRERGFKNIKMVESQNAMGNWVGNRSVANVARVAGYSGDGYEIVDLTLEKERYTYSLRGLPDWKNYVGRSWRDADYRIDFAKFKTQSDNFFTLCLKNQFGVLPLQNKYRHYHARIPYWVCAAYTIANFPVDFGFVDGFTASDGAIGFAVQYDPKKLRLMIASDNIIAVDLVGARMMDVDPWEAPLPRFVMQYLGVPEYEVLGDDSPLEDWENVPDEIQNIVDVAQAIYGVSNLGATLGTLQTDPDEFPPRFPLMRYYYRFVNWLASIIYGNFLGQADKETFVESVHRNTTMQHRP